MPETQQSKAMVWMMNQFQTVESLSGALKALAEHGANATIIAGGTDVMVQHQRDRFSTSMLLSIDRIGELSKIEKRDDGGLEIGALTSHESIRKSPIITQDYPAIAEAARTVGGWQTQAVGTIGGNICNASPAADLLPPLLTVDAEVVLASEARGERRMKLEDLVLGRRSINRHPDELLVRISLPPRIDSVASVYEKVGRRSGMEVAIVGLAVTMTTSGTVETCMIATCAVGPKSCRVPSAEALLLGGVADDKAVRMAGKALVDASSPISDARGSADYRLRVLPKLLARAVSRCREQ